ncbi:nucleotidyltransferase domain-containing protein [Candidatus Woesearchaeota archaeon]|nr:nucleotidyltransferase domain-containing protein [Candidatus Woesearchaeota archaeon]
METLDLFFDDPEGSYHVREIARRTGIHPNTTLRDVKTLAKEGLLLVRRTKAVLEARANPQSERFSTLKRLRNLGRLQDSGLVEFLHKEYSAPEAIILFGSYSRGEDTKRSDIDIAIVTKRKIAHSLPRFERALGRRIQLHEIELDRVSKEFLTSLANGIVLRGYLTL